MIDINDAWYRLSIKAIIKNTEGDILLAYEEKKGIWDLPGGGLDHGEEPEKGLKREIKEEMGLKILEIGEKPECFITANKGLSKTRPWIGNICYEVKVENLDFKASDECSKIGFFNLETIKTIKVIENVEKVFNKLF